jgi:energy-coupling factor transporter ATP-binding protein EcfA2
VKLTVKNFGPLTNIDIKIKDIMVFIGPQASGKSTVAKICSILNGEAWVGKTQAEFCQLFKDKQINFFSDDTLISLGEQNIYQNGKYALSDVSMKNPEFVPFYIPAERILVSMLSESMMGMMAHKIAIPDFILRFGSSFEIARKQLEALDIKPLNVTYF